MNYQEEKLVSGLIRQYAHDNGTESLIGYFADTKGLLSATRKMFGQGGVVDPAAADWLRQRCREHDVQTTHLIASIAQILEIFDGGRSDRAQDHYAALGISADATAEQIKTAYRTLSLQYHPDRFAQNDNYDPRKFIEISTAYHALTEPVKAAPELNVHRSAPQWNRTKKKKINAEQRKKLVAGSIVLLVILLAVSFIGAINVRKRAMIAGLTEDRGAFIPPAQDKLQGEALQDRKIDSVAGVEGKAVSSQIPPEWNENFKVEAQSSLPEAEVGSADVEADEARSALSKESSVSIRLPDQIIDKELPSNDRAAKLSIEPEKQNQGGHIEIPAKEYADKKAGNNGRAESNTASDSSGENKAADTGSSPVPQSKDVQIAREELINNEKPDSAVGDTVNQQKQVAGSEMSVRPETAIEQQEKEAVLENVSDAVMQRRLVEFLKLYEDAYKRRDATVFQSFFTADAVENDKKFSERIAVYSDLFDATKAVSLKVNVLNWNRDSEFVRLDGRFVVSLNYKNGKKLDGRGKIGFTLIEQDNAMRVQELTYAFDK